jgi:outer membrane receptor protein involved in Fe transport
MRAKVFIWLSLLTTSLYGTEEVTDSVALPEVEVSASRLVEPASRQQMQLSVIDSLLIESTHITTPKDVALLIPNVHMPDYGSAMTSSIYIRGIGSRTGEPVLGMVVDGVPLLDKNMYDQTMQDVKSIELLRGPQGSLYGRNSPGGVMEIRSIRPLDFTTHHIRGMVSRSTAKSVGVQASVYRPVRPDFGWGIAARYRQTDGFYTNAFDNRRIDQGRQAGGRLVVDGMPSDEWRVTGTIATDWVAQGAFPYASAGTGIIDFNQPASYRRLALVPSLSAEYRHNGSRLILGGSYQFMHDDMHMDQDYTRADIFTLRQVQHQHNATFDALLYAPKPAEWYEWAAGLSAFVKTNAMHAPVTFMREGIETLILAGANRGIQTVFPEDSIEISAAELPIDSDFGFLNAGAAACHQSRFRFGRWHITADLRLDYEYTRMHYLSTADTPYRFTLMMPLFKTVHTELNGSQAAHYLQMLPRLALSYEIAHATFYSYVAKGYKAGGYNPQIFSTVTQNQMMTDLAADMGIHLAIADPRFTNVAITSYKPETDWTFELGTHFTGEGGVMLNLDAFHVRCYDQQVTVFPNGKTTGRMMANAARSRVWGTEAELQYRWSRNRWGGLIVASYGFADARFISFDDGMGSYAGHFIPYAPKHTAHGLVMTRRTIGSPLLQAVSLALMTDGTGIIYWNEQNDCSQPFYLLWGATLTLEWQHAALQFWGRNLTDRTYDVFYFRSMGNDFLQRGRPRETGINIRINL